MWIRKSPAEVRSEKRSRILRATCLDIVLGAGLWYGLVRLAVCLGLLPSHPISVYIGCGVIALTVPAAWLSSRKAARKNSKTRVCDYCNTLKIAHDEPACHCGGSYLPLSEMKWVNTNCQRFSWPVKDMDFRRNSRVSLN